jgi:hypothetical protein
VTAILIAKVVWFAFNETKMNQFLVAGVAKMMVVGLTIAFTLHRTHPKIQHRIQPQIRLRHLCRHLPRFLFPLLETYH